MKKLIFGYGATGKSVESYFQKNNIEYLIYDDDKKIEIQNDIRFDESKFQEIDEVIISPGIKPTHELLKNINKKELNVLTDIDLFNNAYNGKIIGVTGTNGKTSFVELLTGFLNSEGIKSIAVGNVGKSPLEVIENNYEYVVMELSSFQLYYLNNIDLSIGILLNIHEDHLDWHTNYQDYVESKIRIKEFINTSTNSVSNFFGSTEARTNNLDIKYEFNNNTQFFDETVNIFFQVVKRLGLSIEASIEYIKNTSNLEHRFELVSKFNDITFINDSKSTNFNSVSMATTKADNIVLIMHGLTKKISSKDLNISKNVKTIILPKDMDVDLRDIPVKTIELDSIFDLESILNNIIIPGDTILFSCGGASFNDFINYEARGKFFKKVVSNIRKNYG